MKSFLLWVTFLTRIPLKINFEIAPDDFKRGIWYMPVIGLFIGTVLFGVYTLLVGLFHPAILAVLLLVLYVFITGGFYFFISRAIKDFNQRINVFRFTGLFIVPAIKQL